MIIHKEYSDDNSIVEYSKEEHEILKKYITEMEYAHGFNIEKKFSSYNNYDNDDYLFAAWLINDISRKYNEMFFDPSQNEWREGYKEPPYIHIELYEGNDVKWSEESFEYVYDDKRINMGVTKPDEKGNYTIKVDRHFFLRYTVFLQNIFDSNSKLTISLPDVLKANMEQARKMMSKEEIYNYGQMLVATGNIKLGELYIEKAQAMENGAYKAMPVPGFRKDGSVHNAFIGLIDIEEDTLSIPLKTVIYQTSGFSKYYENRSCLISDLFMNSFRAVFLHEFAHVINGHALLGKIDPRYAGNRDIRICAEQNADDTAVRLLLQEPLYEGIDENPHNPRIRYSKDEIIYEWANRIFSFYLILSWAFRDKDRIWQEITFQEYVNNPEQRHPLYQFRLYSILRRAAIFLSNVVPEDNKPQFFISDGSGIDNEVVEEAYKQALDFINSLESCFQDAYDKEKRGIDQILKENLEIEKKSFQRDETKIPYAPPFFDAKVMEEIKIIRSKWPELKDRLKKAGAVSKLYDSI